MNEYEYVVEKLEGTEWVPKCRYNFEDTEQFLTISQNPSYRILHNNTDITSNYNKSYVKIGISTQTKTYTSEASSKKSMEVDNLSTSDNRLDNISKPMKPAEYKALSDRDKYDLQKRITQLLENKHKRNDIIKTLNVSEATYDVIRSDMKKHDTVEISNNTITEHDTVEESADNKNVQVSHKRNMLFKR